jgi:hypothetical protein
MAPRISLAASALAAAVLLAPSSAHALTVTSPVQSATVIKSTNTPINFQGFSNAFKASKGIPLWATLNSVLITAKGTTGGTTVVKNFNGGASASVVSPGTQNLTVNGIMPLGQVNANTPTPIILPPAPGVAPFFTAATITVTPTVHTFSWNLVPGGTNPLPFFTNNALTLQALSEFAPTITGLGAGEDPALDQSTFTLSSTLTDTFLTFDYTVGAPPSSGVPGPLPILGAASAFAFSRRMRSRIKQVS